MPKILVFAFQKKKNWKKNFTAFEPILYVFTRFPNDRTVILLFFNLLFWAFWRAEKNFFGGPLSIVNANLRVKVELHNRIFTILVIRDEKEILIFAPYPILPTWAPSKLIFTYDKGPNRKKEMQNCQRRWLRYRSIIDFIIILRME